MTDIWTYESMSILSNIRKTFFIYVYQYVFEISQAELDTMDKKWLNSHCNCVNRPVGALYVKMAFKYRHIQLYVIKYIEYGYHQGGEVKIDNT
jgi:hypothetical protein